MPKTCEHHEEQLEAVSVGPIDPDGPIWVNKFTEDTARLFTQLVQHQSQKDPSSPIVIYIDSGGGDAYSMLTMLSALESVPNQIVTVALGKAMSAGAILLAHGDIRYASPHTSIMIHEVTAGAMGHIDDLKIQHDNITALNEKVMKGLAKKCKIKGGLPTLKKMLAKSRDLYLTAEEALKFGIVDHIGVPMLHKSVNIQYMLSSNPRGDNDSAKEAKA